MKTNVTQNRCRVFRKSPWWNLSCDDDVWLREQATMIRAQHSFVDEQLEQVQSAHDELRCYFADHKTMEIRPATTYDLSDKSSICDAPNCEFEAIRQHVRNMKPYMLTVQYNDDNSNDDAIRALCAQQAYQGGYFLLNLRNCPKKQDPTWDISLGFCTNLPGLIRSFAETGEDLHLHFDSAKRVAEAAVESAIARFQRTGSARRWDGTFFTTWSTPLNGYLSKVDRKKAERIYQELQKNLCQTFQTEAALDLACDQDQVLREHFPQTARSHREEILPPDLEEIYEPRHLVQEEDEDDETETARLYIRSQRCWLVHYDTLEQDGKLYVLFLKSSVVQRAKNDLYRCSLPPSPRPGMSPRCFGSNQCIGVDLVDLEVGDGTSAKALNVVCWGTGLQIVQPLWTSYTAKTVMKEFKISWVKHYGWPEIIVHDQGPEFMGNEFQNPAGAAGVDAQSSWQKWKNRKKRDSHSNINCGTWTKSVTLKVRRSLKPQ